MYHVGLAVGDKVVLAFVTKIAGWSDSFIELTIHDTVFLVPSTRIVGIVRGKPPEAPDSMAFAQLLGLPFAQVTPRGDAPVSISPA